MLKVISSFHGALNEFFYGLLESFYAWHAGERLPRPTPAGTQVKFHEKMDPLEIIGLVAMCQALPLDQPERFTVRVNHAVSMRIKGKQEVAKPGELIEVLNTPEIWPKIACQALIPTTLGVWSPLRLTPRGRLQEAASEKKKADFITLPDLTVDNIAEPLHAKEAAAWGNAKKKK